MIARHKYTSKINNQKKKKANYRYLKDNPLRRQIGTTADLHFGTSSSKLSSIRNLALNQAKNMIPAEDEQVDWMQLGPTCIPFGQTDSPTHVLVSGRVTSVVIDPTNPKVIYLGTGQGGVWKTIDGGRNWKATSDQLDSLAIGALVMDPNQPDVLYAGTGEGNLINVNPDSYYGCGIYKTENGGKDWNQITIDGRPFNGARFFRLAINPSDPKIIFAATSYGLFRSTDKGDKWKQLTDPSKSDSMKVVSDVIINPNDTRIVYAAVFGEGIYKSENANDEDPKWNFITGIYRYNGNESEFPPSNLGRIAVGISMTNPNNIYTLMSNTNELIKYFMLTEDGGDTWEQIVLPNLTIGGEPNLETLGIQGSYNLNIAVDPADPNTVYLSGISLVKAIRNPRSKKWTFIDIGKSIHGDHHAFAFHPTDNAVIFSGNDGGIYKSKDGGNTWDDTLNEGLCITQFEFMDQHPNSDAILLAGTQDNGTLQFRNNPAFYLCALGDGGFVAIDPRNPQIVYHTYNGPTPNRSVEGGIFGDFEHGGSWKALSDDPKDFGLITDEKGQLFYPPFVMDQSCPDNLALGTRNIYLYQQSPKKSDNKQQVKWVPISQNLCSQLSPLEFFSAINYANSSLIYAATNQGKLFRFRRNGESSEWISEKVETDPTKNIPCMHIWDIATYPGNDNNVIVVLGGFPSNKDQSSLNKRTSRIWFGEISGDGVAKWKDMSGKENMPHSVLPDIPVNCLAIESNDPEIIYIGTDVGVFRTLDGGNSWTKFGKGLPNCAVLDMRLFQHEDDHNSIRLLRVVTHGRGMWEIELEKRNKNCVDLYVRDHIMDTGRFIPSSSGIMKSSFEDTLRNIKYDEDGNLKFDNYDHLYWWMCADIKVDPPYYQMDIDEIDYVKFEYRIKNKNLKRGKINRIYIQIHNRGIKAAGEQKGDEVRIMLLYANVTNSPTDDTVTPFIPKLPDIPQDFWTQFSNNSVNSGEWKQIGEVKLLPEDPKTLTNIEPTVICWEWEPPESVSNRVGLLVVVDSPEDPILEENKSNFDIENLVRNDKHMGVSVVRVDPLK